MTKSQKDEMHETMVPSHAASDFSELSTATIDALARGDFRTASDTSLRIMSLFPGKPQGFLWRSQSLIAQGCVEDALITLRRARQIFPDNTKITSFARGIAMLHGRFTESINYTEALLKSGSDEQKNQIFLFQSHMSSGNFVTARKLLDDSDCTFGGQVYGKLRNYHDEYERLASEFPVLISAWTASLNQDPFKDDDVQAMSPSVRVPVIQYWSQGSPPADVGFVVSYWNKMLKREGMNEISLFDRQSAGQWIENNAPEFSEHFSKSFHYAMESDIFRIAFASRHPCMYIDIDSWPLERTAGIVKLAIGSGGTLLYFRSYRPWLVNGLFISRPDCVFFKEILAQCRAVNLDSMPKSRRTIEHTFGPTRYNMALSRVLRGAGELKHQSSSDISGCAHMKVDGQSIFLTHDAAVAAVKPPFTLGYKATGDYWKEMTTLS